MREQPMYPIIGCVQWTKWLSGWYWWRRGTLYGHSVSIRELFLFFDFRRSIRYRIFFTFRTGVCTGRKQIKNFCDDLPDRTTGEEQNVTHKFFCHSDVLKREKLLSLACANRIWTPKTNLCTSILIFPFNRSTPNRRGAYNYSVSW